CMQGLEFPVTF
nr:immunoglobulin light chain junction region [Macaca mulatta]MOV34969.1 immunoglobulin light chain junction region [Macaca mulatta]MOV74705.1 immunoglobulin light chain junction region [Macaca mulatta]MOV74844.1 immunoglobulin light chain junction region [Macaca mulatta]MOV75039.1 immunoglobulin light chain junction region [Macaca mulatta]